MNKQTADNASMQVLPTLSGGQLQGIRDADVNQRHVPTDFQDYPQQTNVHKDITMYPESQDKNTLNDAMQNLQNVRNADTKDSPDTIDFQSVNASQVDNSDIMNKLQALEVSREQVVDTDTNTSDNSKRDEIHLASAMQTFDDQTKQLNQKIQQETSAIQQSKSQREEVFQESTVFRNEMPDVLGKSQIADDALATQMETELESMHFSLLENTEASLVTNKLKSDVLVNQTVLRNKVDEQVFQKALQLTKEEDALKNLQHQNVEGVCLWQLSSK